MRNPYLQLFELLGGKDKTEKVIFNAKVMEGMPNVKLSLNDIILEKDYFFIDSNITSLSRGDKVILLKTDLGFVLISKVRVL